MPIPRKKTILTTSLLRLSSLSDSNYIYSHIFLDKDFEPRFGMPKETFNEIGKALEEQQDKKR